CARSPRSLFDATASPSTCTPSLHDALPISIYNVLGDPTVEIKTRPPINIGLEIPVLTRELIEFEVTCETCPPLDELVAVLHYLRSEEHTSELQSRGNVVCRPRLDQKNSPCS